MKQFKLLFLLAMAVMLSSCAAGPNLSSMQLRQLTTKTIDGSYENVFRAAMTVLQDQGYVIKNTDMNSGLIVANVDREASAGSQILGALFLGSSADKNTVIEVSTIVNKLNEKTQELRINIQETDYTMSGNKSSIDTIDDPEIYKALFDQIIVEVKRREAMNK